MQTVVAEAGSACEDEIVPLCPACQCFCSCSSVPLSHKGLSHKACPKSFWYNSPLGALLRELVLEVSPPFPGAGIPPLFLISLFSCVENMGAPAF